METTSYYVLGERRGGALCINWNVTLPGFLLGLGHIWGNHHITFNHITASSFVFRFRFRTNRDVFNIQKRHKMSITLRLLCNQPRYIGALKSSPQPTDWAALVVHQRALLRGKCPLLIR
jgi:hypothetical protein